MKKQLGLAAASLGCFLITMAGPLPAAVTDGLVFYVPFTTDMYDVQNGLTPNVRGAATQEPAGGLVGGYLHLENNTTIEDQSIDFPDAPVGTSDFSTSIWVRSADAANGQASGDVSFMSNKDWDSGNNYGWVLARGAGLADRLQWNFRTPAGSRADFDPTDANAIVFDGAWHHVAVVYVRTANASFYVDGVLIGTVDISGNAAGDINAAGQRLSLGNDGTGAYDHGNSSTYNGDLDEAAIWTRAISIEEINEIHSAGLQGLGLFETTAAKAFFKNTVPTQGSVNAAGNTPIGATIQAGATPLDPASFKMFVDGEAVTPTPSQDGADTVLRYQPTQILAPNSLHSVRIEAGDSGTPPWLITNAWTFTVTDYAVLPTNYARPLGSANTPGFRARSAMAQAAVLAGTVARAIAQLNGSLIDPATTQPYVDVATPGPNPDGSYDIDVVNFEQSGVGAGFFTGDQPFPGLAAQDNDYFATEALGYLELSAGYYRFGVNSDDGFAVRVGMPPQSGLNSTVVGVFDGPRSISETPFDFFAPVSGIYAFELVFFEITGGASCEFYSIDAVTGERVLINDTANPNAVKSFRVLAPTVAQPPYVREVSPAANAVDVKVDVPITAVIVDGATTLDPGSVKLFLNGTEVAVTSDTVGSVTTVTAQPAAALLYKTTYTGTLIFGDGTVLVTNRWQFATRPANQKPSITGQWDFDHGDLSAAIGSPLQFLDGATGTSAAQTQFGTTTSFGIPDIQGVPAKVMRFGGATSQQVGYVMTHGAVPNGSDEATKVNQWTLIMDILIQHTAGSYFSFVQIDTPNNASDGDLFANFSGDNAGLGISGSYPNVPPVVSGRWHRIVFAVDAAQTISKYVDGVKTADQTGWSGAGFDGRHAMNPTAILFGDDDGETQPAFINSIQFLNYKLSDAGVAALGGPAAEGIPTVSGQWDFENGSLQATIGNDLLFRTEDTFATEFLTDSINGVPAGVMHFMGVTPTDGYLMYHGALANGGGQKVNQYSVIMDLFFPSSSGGYRSLWQTETNTPTTGDGDFFVNGGNGLGISSAYQGNLTPDTWHRVAFTFDLTRRELGKYIDGANVLTAPVGASPPADAGPYQYLSTSSGGVDQRWALEDSAILFADEDGELNEGLVSSIQFRVGVLSPAQAALLGGPSAGGIPANFPVMPKLSLTRQGTDLLITWPESFAGWVLETSLTLGPTASWSEVGDITVVDGNYTSLQAPAEPTRFFRLRQ